MFPKVHAGMDLEMVSDVDSEGNKKKMNFKNEIHQLVEKSKKFPGLVWKTMWKVGKEDPRRFIHALKVGLSLTLVSLIYLLEPLFKGIGHNAIWAVMTVVVVLEFTAGWLLSSQNLFPFTLSLSLSSN